MRFWQFYLILVLCCLPSALLEQAIRATNVTRTGLGHRQQAPTRNRLSTTESKPAKRLRPTSHNVTSPTNSTLRAQHRAVTLRPGQNSRQTTDNHRQLASSNRLNNHHHHHHQDAQGAPTTAPLVGAYGLTGDQELLCLVRLYVDTYVEHSFQHSGQIDMNDRLIFLVPLVIIYWHHRHHTEPIPFQEIDGVLQEIGDEADIHRRVLREVKDKVAGQQQYCSLARSGATSSQDNNSSSSNNNSTTDAQYQQATEALRILRDWIGSSERLVDEVPPATGEQLGADELMGRQSGVREIRVWFQALASLTRRRPGYASRSRQSSSTTTTPRPAVYLSIAPLVSSSSSNRRPAPVATHVSVFESPPPPPMTTGTVEPFGLPRVTPAPTTQPTNTPPHLDTSQQQVASVTTTPPTVNQDTSRGVGAASNINRPIVDQQTSLINQLKDIQASLQPASLNSTTSTTTAAQYSEFFELVSSIISEIDQIHNTTTTTTGAVAAAL